MYLNRRKIKATALLLLCTMVFQLVYPNRALALTSGPSQPEVQGFEPVGTTDMVEMFSGDFVYNVPLLDVEGYPVNISYHGGINMDQEASWVGLGWNINPGEINRTVRGVPDDFDGDSVMKVLHIKDERNVTIGANVNGELLGVGPPILNLSASLGGNVNFSNYKGTSVNLTGGVNANILGFVSAGLNVGVGSQSGANIDYNAGLQFSTSQIINANAAAGVGIGYSSGYNTRSGLATRSFNVSASVSAGGAKLGSWGGSIPIGVINNIVPVITNSSVMRSYNGHVRVGGEATGLFAAVGVNARLSVLHYDENGSRKTYGYLHADKATEDDILDFTRERDGFFNQSMKNLPLGNLTYDIYSVSGQGTGGSFRPFRNDFGSVFDPVSESDTKDDTYNAEAGIGNIFSAGFDINRTNTTIHSGPWGEYKRNFIGNSNGSIYEDVYFKQGGELTQVDPAYFSQINGFTPIADAKTIPVQKVNSSGKRDARGNLVYYFNGAEATKFGVASDSAIYSYNSDNGFEEGYPKADKKDYIARLDRGKKLGKKSHHISEIVQVQTNGKRYVYGIPAMNNVQKEVTFAVDKSTNSSDKARGLVSYSKGIDDSKDNSKGIDKFYSANYTSSFAHSHLLTSVLSVDYADIKGDGPTDDDFGTYTKFNYTRKEHDYRWRAPIDTGKAQYVPGFESDANDDKASYLIGSREQWMLHSIETKNFVAEFYTSPRSDAKGVVDAICKSGEGFNEHPYDTALNAKASSYKLDSIKLYNKHDRFINKDLAIPIKTVYFSYDYSLCIGVPNKDDAILDSIGKLTLKKIFVKYGNSDKSLLSPYQFNYSDFNPPYDLANKDRWGSFKRNKTPLTNNDFPFVDQNSDSLDIYASAWSLTNIQLPSGGVINVNYEADDYAYVQNREATEMFVLQGVGKSKYFIESNQMYIDENNPNLFAYFKRRPGSENYAQEPRDRYFKNQSSIYFNFALNLVSPNYEPIKGYAKVIDVGICPNDTSYGYVAFFPSLMNGGGVTHPAVYTGLNIGRYHLSHLIFPGSDPDASDLENIIYGMWDAVKGLVKFMQNPNVGLMKKNKAKYVDLDRSFIRLNNPDGHKVGGGHRVKSLLFYDNWNQLVGGDAQNATYGKSYDYTMVDNGGRGIISSGVASYEPQIGADENPFKEPNEYKVQNASNWPPSDPIELYQEMPVGETFFPSASVGYSKVSVTSIHKEVGRSAQGQDIYEYYTAKDFPTYTVQTGIKELAKENKFRFKEQRVILSVSQGYTVVLNDMHGKTKRVEHRALLPKNNKFQVISYQDYKYNTSGGGLNNQVDVLLYNKASNKIVKSSQVLGQEIDLTLDTREKVELTTNDAFFFSSNGFYAVVPVYVPVPVPWNGEYRNEFRSVVTTKIVQQYGILREVQSFDEGAVTTVRNEAYDPFTGQALITSVNNEYNDIEHSLTTPAYWAYKAMGPSYQNIGYKDYFNYIAPVSRPYLVYGSTFRLPTNTEHFIIGDEVLVSGEVPGGGAKKDFTAWVVGYDTTYNYIPNPSPEPGGRWKACINPIITVRNSASAYISSLTGGLSYVDVKVIRSGYKNQLNESVQSVTAMDPVVDAANNIKTKFSKVINIKAQEFNDTIYARLDRPATSDTLNDFLNGKRSIHRPSKEYVYFTNRDYKGSGVRKAGLFDATSLWSMNSDPFPVTCVEWTGPSSSATLPDDLTSTDYDYLRKGPLGGVRNMMRPAILPTPIVDRNWKMSREITKYTPWGFEAENIDALGNFSAALYRYNNMQPVAIAQNARQKELLNENFEDFGLLQILGTWIPYEFSSIFTEFGGHDPIPFTPYAQINTSSGSAHIQITNETAHTGQHSLLVGSANTLGGSAFGIALPVVDESMELKMEFGKLINDKEYILSYWFKPTSVSIGTTAYTLPTDVVSGATSAVSVLKSNIIDGWQQVETRFKAPSSGTVVLRLPTNIYVDDVRFFPLNSNMKSFVYNAFNQKLMATLDENNYATFYEYDQEGNLVRTKRETERGIITLSESRSANPKK